MIRLIKWLIMLVAPIVALVVLFRVAPDERALRKGRTP